MSIQHHRIGLEGRPERRPERGQTWQRGFTLVELITVMLIMAVLAAMALPRYADVSNKARIAKVQQMAGTLQTTAKMFKAKCMITSGCNYKAPTSFYTFADLGLTVWMAYGYPDGGDALNNRQIDTLVDTTGFVATRPDVYHTSFEVDSAPDTANCAAVYEQARTPDSTPTVTTLTSGC